MSRATCRREESAVATLQQVLDDPALKLEAVMSDAPAAETASVTVRPLDQALGQWTRLGQAAKYATLFHTPAWADVLRRAYGLRVQAAMLEWRGQPLAGCLLARTRNPMARRMVGLPFSDSCPPLGVDPEAVARLMHALASAPPSGGAFELRGIRGAAPWQTVECFEQWSIDLARPFPAIERGADRNFRRQVKRAANEQFRIETGDTLAMLRRFYAIQLETRRRLGVPPQPLRFFNLVREAFAPGGGLEIWIASLAGHDQAAVVLLRDEAQLYAKWSARAAESAPGASHLLFFSILEHHAGRAAALDLGRTDLRNSGLARFKAEMGAAPSPLPYSFFPAAPRRISAEDPDRSGRPLTRLWRRLPLPVTRAIGAVAYRYLA